MAEDKTKLEEIYEAVLPEMEAHGIEDTDANRHAFLSGMRDAWVEDPFKSIEKTLYVVAINLEIARLAAKINAAKFRP